MTLPVTVPGAALTRQKFSDLVAVLPLTLSTHRIALFAEWKPMSQTGGAAQNSLS